MGILHDKLNSVLAEMLNYDALKKAVLRRAAKRRGVCLSDAEIDTLATAMENAVGHEATVSVSVLGHEGTTALTAEDLHIAMNELSEELNSGVEAAVTGSLKEMPSHILASLYRDAPVALKERRSLSRAFNQRLRQRWRDGLDRLEMLIMIAQEAGESLRNDLRDEVSSNPLTISQADAQLFEVLIGLHVRACRTASEVQCLLNAGFADGANARWRSLHEIAIISLFISQQQGDLPERYLRHAAVERYKASQQYQSHCHALKQDPITKAEMDSLEAEFKRKISKYGADFKNDYGWAAAALCKNKPTFADIEASLDMERWRPYYKMACHGVHAGSQGLFWSLGAMPDSGPTLLAGASNAGLCDPGHSTAISLTLASAALLTIQPNMDALVSAEVMQLLCHDIGRAFAKAHDELERDIENSEGDSNATE